MQRTWKIYDNTMASAQWAVSSGDRVRSRTRKVSGQNLLRQFIKVAKAIADYEDQSGNRTVICDVHEEAGCDRLRKRARDRQGQANQKYHQHRRPGAS